jgi:ubiquinone biosynthesis protein UbiJ
MAMDWGDSIDDAPPAGIQIPDALLAAAEGTINAVLGLDPEGAAQLASVQGRVLLVELHGFGTRIYIVPGESGLLLSGAYEAEPDCTVRGSPAALLRMALAEHREDSVFEGTVQIDGDNRVAQTLGEVFQRLDIDWEEQLSKLIGDSLARRIMRQARASERWARRSGDTLTHDLREWLQEEGRVLPSDDEMQDFLNGVDSIRDDVERLAARVERLAARAQSRSRGSSKPASASASASKVRRQTKTGAKSESKPGSKAGSKTGPKRQP